MSDRDTRRLVRRCQHGDREAWDEFLDRYGRLVWSVAHRQGASAEEAEEIFQRSWVALVEGIQRLEDPDRVVSWVAATARHHAWRLFDEHRRHRRVESLDENRDDRADGAAARDEELAADEMAVLVREAVAGMDDRCRQLLELLFLADPPLDYREIAAETGLAVGSIGPIRARCLNRLRIRFAGLYQAGGTTDW